MWDYIKQMNAFIDWRMETLSPSEVVLYLRLFQINNAKHRETWFSTNNLVLALMTGMTEKVLIRSRNSLSQKGLIEFIPGKKGEPTKYRLLPLYEEKSQTKKDCKKYSKSDSENAVKVTVKTQYKRSESDSKSDSKSDSESTPPALENSGSRDPLKDKVKDKDKVKEKDINTPIPPKGGEVDIFGEYVAGSIDLLQTLDDFEGMRKTLKKPMTERAKKLLCSKLTKLAGDNTKLKIALLEQSILHSWLDVYPLRDEEPKGGSMRGKDNNGGYDSDNKAKIGGLDDFDRADQNQKYPWEV